MSSNPIEKWLTTNLSGPSLNNGLGDAVALGSKPPLNEAYAVYIGLFAPVRVSSLVIGPMADFVEVLRQHSKDVLYSDEEWINFFMPYVNNEDVARDLWDQLLCQPSYTDI